MAINKKYQSKVFYQVNCLIELKDRINSNEFKDTKIEIPIVAIEAPSNAIKILELIRLHAKSHGIKETEISINMFAIELRYIGKQFQFVNREVYGDTVEKNIVPKYLKKRKLSYDLFMNNDTMVTEDLFLLRLMLQIGIKAKEELKREMKGFENNPLLGCIINRYLEGIEDNQNNFTLLLNSIANNSPCVLNTPMTNYFDSLRKPTLLWHYTTQMHLEHILFDKILKVSHAEEKMGVKPAALWLSSNPVWEPCVENKVFHDEAREHVLTKQELWKTIGLARISVKYDKSFVTWKKYKYETNTPIEQYYLLEDLGMEQGAEPSEWYASFKNIAQDKWIGVEVWDGEKWVDYHADTLN